jgi:hypothetical protein
MVDLPELLEVVGRPALAHLLFAALLAPLTQHPVVQIVSVPSTHAAALRTIQLKNFCITFQHHLILQF